MSATKLNNVDRELAHPQRSAGDQVTALTAIATMATSYTNMGDFEIGSNPCVGGYITWTKSAGTILTVSAEVSIDDTTYVDIPDYGSPSSGASVVSKGSITFTSALWCTGASGSVPFNFNVPGYRYIRIKAKSDNASGSCTGKIAAGTVS